MKNGEGKEFKDQSLSVALNKKLKDKGLLQYRKAALQSTMALWNDGGGRSRRLWIKSISRGVVTAELLSEYNE